MNMGTISWLRNGLSSHNGFVRKGAAATLAGVKWLRGGADDDEALAAAPPVLVNSFPKSGTHLLLQLAEGLPDRVNYGVFLASMTSSFRFRERSVENTRDFIRRFVPGEIVRGHLFYDKSYVEELAAKRVVNYLIYRDPRAVVVSEAHYLREMNHWHKLAPYFRRVPSITEAIALSITGLDPTDSGGVNYPNIARRFARYAGWLHDADCLAIRYEDLLSESRPRIIAEMAELYARHCSQKFDRSACVAAMTASIAPEKSHTFRTGKKTGWQREFTPELRRLFNDVAGDLLIELGYERDRSWLDEPVQVLTD